MHHKQISEPALPWEGSRVTALPTMLLNGEKQRDIYNGIKEAVK